MQLSKNLHTFSLATLVIASSNTLEILLLLRSKNHVEKGRIEQVDRRSSGWVQDHPWANSIWSIIFVASHDSLLSIEIKHPSNEPHVKSN